MKTSSQIPARAVDCHECAIRRVCVFGQLDNARLAALEPRIRERLLRRGDVLSEEGEIARFVQVVKVGTVFGYRRGLDGHSRPIGVATRGNAFGLFGVYGNPNPASGIALTAGRVCAIPAVALREMGARDAPVLAHLCRSAMQACGAMATWSEAMRLPGAVNQLAYVLVLLADANRTSTIELPPHAALARLLGTRRETIARALATLESEGCIRRAERQRCETLRGTLLARVARSTH